MKQFAIIGLGNFGVRVLEEMVQLNVEVMVIDRDSELIEEYKDRVAAAYVVDAIKEDLIRKVIPDTIDAAIVDLGHTTEASILCTNYLAKMGISKVIAKAETDQHGEILRIVGATDVVYPNREAARRITLPLLATSLSSYFPISKGMVIAELSLPSHLHGKTIVEADLRQKHRLNIVAVRHGAESEYRFVDPGHKIHSLDTMLVVGTEADIAKIAGPEDTRVRRKIQKGESEEEGRAAKRPRPATLRGSFLRRLFRGRR